MKKWNELPLDMQVEEVKKYYKILEKHKAGLVAKRIFDIVVAVILLVLLSPVLLILSILIKLDSKGPVLFRQIRVTTYGKKFRRYDTVQLSSAQKFLTVRHSVECIRKLPEGCCIPFHFFLLGMAFTKRQHFFFFLRFSRKDSFCHVPEYQQYADYEHGNDPFLHIFPSPYNLH